MKILVTLIFVLLAILPAWAGHEEQAYRSPEGMDWFCNSDVALYMHPFLPVKATIQSRETIYDKDYVVLFVYNETLEHIAEVIHEVINGRLGPVLFFRTLPDGRILCDKLQRKEGAWKLNVLRVRQSSSIE